MNRMTEYDEPRLLSLLESRKYDEVLACIRELDPKHNSALTRDDLARLYFVQAQCLYRLGEFRNAAIKLKCSIKLADPLNDNLLYARQKYVMGEICLGMGKLDRALSEYAEAYAFFKRIRDHHRMLITSTEIAQVHFQKGELSRAIELWESIIRDAKTYKLPTTVRTVSFNLCRVLLWTGNLARVRELLNSVGDDCTDALNNTWLESLWGTYCVRMLDHDRARLHLEKALTIARANGYRRDEVVCMEYLGLNEFYQGNYAHAKSYFEQILAMEEITASATAQTQRLLTDVQVALGELDQAAETAVRAEEAITKIKEWIELGCLHRSLALLADKRGDTKNVTEHFDKATKILDSHAARYEVAVTHLAMGQSRHLPNDLRRNLLQSAEALFTEMAIPNRIAQVRSSADNLSSTTAVRGARNESGDAESAPTIITQNPQMTRILSEAVVFARSDATVLITGETGTGKDLLASLIHSLSLRASGPFKNENMSRFPRELIDSELFGYERGSHSRAEKGRPGLIELADGGTFCLNEIAELPLDMQTKLLQVIEEGRVRRVGGGEPRPVNVRFLAMTNKDLVEMVERGSFREDLFYRFEGFHLHLPPLRERLDDLPLLFRFFLSRLGFGDFSEREAALIVTASGSNRFEWPGNVRQLRRVLQRAVLLTPSGLVLDLNSNLSAILRESSRTDVESAQRAVLISVLEKNGGNQVRAARELGIPTSTFRRRLREFGVL